MSRFSSFSSFASLALSIAAITAASNASADEPTPPAGAVAPTPPTTEPTPPPRDPAPPVAGPPHEADAKKETEDHLVYLSFSPFHLLLPVVEIQGEFRLHHNLGVALIGGLGSIRADTLNGSTTKFTVWEVGGQVVGYPVGHFDNGMQLGLEVLYAGISGGEQAGDVKITGSGTGLAIGPVIGYKLATQIGFSFNVQVGAEYLAVRAEASGGGASASAEDSRFIPVLNANIGWSF